MPRDNAGRRAWVKYQLELRGHTLGTIARELGVSRSCPRDALWKPYPKMEIAIADKLGVDPQDIWPERYGPDGKPNRKKGRRSSTHRNSVAKDQSAANGNVGAWK